MYIKDPYYFAQLVYWHALWLVNLTRYILLYGPLKFIDVFVAKMFRDLSQTLLDRLASKTLKLSCTSEMVY